MSQCRPAEFQTLARTNFHREGILQHLQGLHIRSHRVVMGAGSHTTQEPRRLEFGRFCGVFRTWACDVSEPTCRRANSFQKCMLLVCSG